MAETRDTECHKKGESMNAKEFAALLAESRACAKAVAWAKGKSLAVVWKTCKRAVWMLWLVGNMVGKEGWPTRQTVVLAVCDCAETSLPIFEKKYPGDKRPRVAIETPRTWCEGKATIEQVRVAANAASAAAYAAYTAAYAAYAYAAYTAAYAAAAYAAYAAYAYAYAAYAAAYAAYAYAAYAAAYAANADAAYAAYAAATATATAASMP